jgi:polysaccharide biosynthesis protein PslH
MYQLEGHRVRQLERRLVERAQSVAVTSTVEADLLRGCFPHVEVRAIPNGVDLDYFKPVEDARAIRGSAPPGLACVFVGALDYRANVDGVSWFCRAAWPEIRRRFPQAKFVLVGQRPNSLVRRLGEIPGVEVVGEVEDVRPHLHRARIAVVPLRIARGIQNKVLEALAVGKPVIASPQALAGLDIFPGEHVVQAETPGEWVAGIDMLLSNESECHRLGAAGRDFVCEHHRWDRCLEPFADLLGVSDAMIPVVSLPVGDGRLRWA